MFTFLFWIILTAVLILSAWLGWRYKRAADDAAERRKEIRKLRIQQRENRNTLIPTPKPGDPSPNPTPHQLDAELRNKLTETRAALLRDLQRKTRARAGGLD